MAPSITEPVTIDRAYFETLLRRANPMNDGRGAITHTGIDETIVPVPREKYNELLLLARQFANLKRSLMGAGVTEENIATLVLDATGVPETEPHAEYTPTYRNTQRTELEARSEQVPYSAPTFNATAFNAYSYASNNNIPGNHSYFQGGPKPSGPRQNHDWTSDENIGGTLTPTYSADEPTDTNVDSLRPKSQPSYARMCNRTVSFSGLSALTTLADVTSVVRGGQLLDIFIRNAEHTALVSFVHEDDAVQFYEYARKNDIYIKNKRVLIRWADRHFIMPTHIANKVAVGATRNLVIRRCGAAHTEDSVREDLDHIHNLIVIGVEFIGGSCYIKTNSVHNAMFARTCMMSRAKYKGSKIEWGVDECDLPIEVNQKTSAQPIPEKVAPLKAAAPSKRNRFDMLRLDDDDNQESDDKVDSSSSMLSTVDVAA
ncbi:hypothetical protein F4808DRAFT_431763 [Astrocystis sublimbata]|nr:hypothetical protein F4808DRAFT_431763 [Astrocystis sublimbata]